MASSRSTTAATYDYDYAYDYSYEYEYGYDDDYHFDYDYEFDGLRFGHECVHACDYNVHGETIDDDCVSPKNLKGNWKQTVP